MCVAANGDLVDDINSFFFCFIFFFFGFQFISFSFVKNVCNKATSVLHTKALSLLFE